MTHPSDNDYGMFTDEGDEFVGDFILGNLLDMARIGYFMTEEDDTLKVDWRHIETHIDAYVYGVADVLSLKGIEDFKELGDTVVRGAIKIEIAYATEKFIKKISQEESAILI